MPLPSMSLEGMLLVMQIMLHVDCLRTFVLAATTPEATEFDTLDTIYLQDLYNLLAPPTYVLSVSLPLLMCFNFGVAIGPKSTVGSFIARYTTPASREPLFLSSALCLASVSATMWEALMLYGKRHLATLALVVMWCGSFPFYLVLSRCYRAPNTLVDVAIFTLGELSVRLFFTWLTGAVAFAVLDEIQYLYGAFFSYIVYAQLMGGILALALGTYTQGRDPVVALMATWFLVGLAHRKCAFEGETKETFEKLKTAATVVKPVFLLLLIIDSVRSIRHFLESVSATVAHAEVGTGANGEGEEQLVIAVYGTV
ncbi:hypothetical protein PRNP1_013362 [Phytophthora ramorum]